MKAFVALVVFELCLHTLSSPLSSKKATMPSTFKLRPIVTRIALLALAAFTSNAHALVTTGITTPVTTTAIEPTPEFSSKTMLLKIPKFLFDGAVYKDLILRLRADMSLIIEGVGSGGATPQSTTAFQVAGRFLRDVQGNNINLRGVNVPIFKSGWVDDLQTVAQAVNSSGANTVRLEWWSHPKNNEPYYQNIANLDRAITQYANLGMLPIVELHDSTCYLAIPQDQCNNQALFKTLISDFWTRSDVMALIKKHQNHLIINLANEWGTTYNGAADEAAFVQNYVTAITSIRNAWAAAGIGNLPLMVDAPNGGAGGKVFISNGNGQTIVNADPLKNTLLSTHTYWADTDGYTSSSITNLLSDFQNSGLPIVLGEVGTTANGSPCGQDNVDWNTILTQATNRSMGTLAWSWYEEGNCNDMNITPDGITLPANDGAQTFRNQVLRNGSYGLNKAVRFNIPQ